MEITEKQIKQIARSIYVLDIKTYIEQNYEEYKKFLEEDTDIKE